MTPLTQLMLVITTLLVVLVNAREDPECFMSTVETAHYFGYPGESHIVRTADDYLLELHRIPHGKDETQVNKNRPVVFLQHGLLADDHNFLSNLANQSAATVFADAGFDVWLANSRGTPASQKHIGYGPENAKFWNFSWQDIAEFDLTASVKYVLQETKQDDLYYVGHSQGTIIMFAKLSEDPEFARKIRQFHAMAPVATVSHIGGLFKVFGNRLMDFARFLLYRMPNSPLVFPTVIQKFISKVCSFRFAQNLCTLDIGIVDGFEKQFNMSRVGTYLCHMPAATSTRNLLHWVQIVKSRKFEKFDFGLEGNMAVYGQVTPPVYNMANIMTPTFLYWSKDDILADTIDIRETILAKMNKTIAFSQELEHYTHLDFVFGVNAAREVYKPMIDRMVNDDQERKKNSLRKHMKDLSRLHH